MNERVKYLRKVELKMTQDKFGEKLGVGKSAISKIEKGQTALTDQMIKLICTTYNVNEKWLRTGDGDIENLVEDETAAIVANLLEDGDQDPFYQLILSTIKLYQSYDEKGKEVFKSFARNLADEMQKSDD